ncbi:flagellar motor switch protein FliG [Nitratireductor aquimarinus]|uniref:Flagellar motor switch protein FliG n=1 Tax=Nitratireductor aquimarinus TaxID=889300 RepID=A0ABU4AGI8_9HYPH|nr:MULTISPECIES: FliG C-terminal domain-containing protein [Alphaproteobacteria]MBY6021693.1 flagellar motor switch protein FliG [Nitratireductor sp. DP7N14-4]MBN7756716.1 flagellar motor switch protein FliG [Nitratireductor aquimarinus]MBN7761897.1 flagellar motor switch protein FliG [Nitratireductor aquibiodomus]MBN7775161.1 flagellar motor switch protein FliG [Nitratireductor pacificus]MBN7781175.1 flagellar motor switch protein FliG [Nitratireductor pacificus]
MTEALALTQAQKAATILVAMGKPAAGRLLKFFKQDELKALMEGARLLRTIPQAELEKVVGEFEAEFTEGAGLLDSADSIDTILTETLSEEEMNLLMGRNDPKAGEAEEIWAELEKLKSEELIELVSSEHPQVIAAILSGISPAIAAKVLVSLEKALRTAVVARMAATGDMPAAAKKLIENRMADLLRDMRAGKDSTVGLARVASLLNELDKEQADEVIHELERSGTSDVKAIRSQLFSFEEIVLLDQKARVALFDGLSSDLVTTALRNASPDAVEAVLSALGQRTRRMIEAELSVGSEDVPETEIHQARKRISAMAVQLSQQGSFELPGMQQQAAA